MSNVKLLVTLLCIGTMAGAMNQECPPTPRKRDYTPGQKLYIRLADQTFTRLNEAALENDDEELAQVFTELHRGQAVLRDRDVPTLVNTASQAGNSHAQAVFEDYQLSGDNQQP